MPTHTFAERARRAEQPLNGQFSAFTPSSSFLPNQPSTLLGVSSAGKDALLDTKTFARSSPIPGALEGLTQTGINVDSLADSALGVDADEPSFLDNLFGDKNKIGNITGLASTLFQAAALPSLLKNAKLQNKSLQFNLDTANTEQNRRNKNIAGFNRRPTSAFAG